MTSFSKGRTRPVGTNPADTPHAQAAKARKQVSNGSA